ncbi:phosphotransferase family protein [Kitasatospora paranensis]|uniref:phosphotransferase family protein n=1 Tax=Kitasatospora paranensis TaxID=258053 RepID=UPI0031E94C5F
MVLKTAPDADTPALTHEQGLLGTEQLFHRLAADAGLPVPTVRHHEPAGATAPAEWLLLDHLDGTTWEAAQARIGASDRAALRHRPGELAATVAGVTGPVFGYPQPVRGLAAADWPTAFAGMLHAVLADAERFGVALPVPEAVLADLPARFAAELAEVRRPALVHFDAWEGNILLDGTPSTARPARPPTGRWTAQAARRARARGSSGRSTANGRSSATRSPNSSASTRSAPPRTTRTSSPGTARSTPPSPSTTQPGCAWRSTGSTWR